MPNETLSVSIPPYADKLLVYVPRSKAVIVIKLPNRLEVPLFWADGELITADGKLTQLNPNPGGPTG